MSPKQAGKITIFNVKELCELLSLSYLTLTRYLKEGTIKGRKVGGKWLVTDDALKEYLEGNGTDQEETQTK